MSKPKRGGGRKPNAFHDWRDNVEKLVTEREEYQYMLANGNCTDCTFVVGLEEGETRKFKAHRVHVARKSAVFEAMLLRGEMLEARTGVVRIVDLTPKIFQLLLDFIYGKRLVTSSYQQTQDLAYAAHKYQVKALLENCVSRMIALISPETTWTALDTAHLLQEQRLEQKCIQILQRDTLRCITDDSFVHATEKSVVLLLQQDKMNIENEELLVNSIVHWAQHAARQRGLPDNGSGVRAVLKPRLLSLIRLLAMSPQQFMLGPRLAGWLTSEEKVAISECLRTKNICSLPQHLSSVAQKRRNVTSMASAVRGKTSQEKLICQREMLGSRPNVQQDFVTTLTYDRLVNSTLIFRVSSSCKILGVKCASRCRPSDPTAISTTKPVYWECIEAFKYEYRHTLSTQFKIIQCGGVFFKQNVPYNSTITIMFDDPLLAENENWYSIQLEFYHNTTKTTTPPGEYPNPTRASNVYTDTGVEFVFRTEELEGYYTSQNDGIIKSLIFSR